MVDSFYCELKQKIEDYFANTPKDQILKDIEEIRKNIHDIDPEIAKIINENFWDLL